MDTTLPNLAKASTVARKSLLLALLLAECTLLLVVGDREELAMDLITLGLFAAAPLLVWFTVEPEPSLDKGPGSETSWWHFPFQPGGATGVVFFLLVLGLVIGVYVGWLRLFSRHEVWFADDDPMQLVLGGLYACVYVLLPVGLCSPILHRWWGRTIAVTACGASYPFWMAAFPPGPRIPNGLTEFGDPWRMISCVLSDGSFIGYALDDLAALLGLAALGVLLNVRRIVRRWRALGLRDLSDQQPEGSGPEVRVQQLEVASPVKGR
jgi:hypothetical protein